MTITLDGMRARVRRYLDDTTASVNNQRWSTADIDTELLSSMADAMMRVARQGNLYTQTLAITSTSQGVVDLTPYSPLTITRVAIADGDARRVIEPASEQGSHQLVRSAMSLVISYVPAPSLPGAGGSNVIFGSAANTLPQLEEYAAIRAAARLKITEGDLHVALERAKDDLERAIAELAPIPAWTPMRVRPWGFGSGSSSYRWIYAGPSTVQLVSG